MENLYVRLGWPEYQKYQSFTDFDEYSVYDPIEDTWFIEKEWYDNKL